MIIQEIKNIRSEKKDLRKFGLTVGIALAVFGALFLWREKETYKFFLIASAVLIVLSLTIPSVLKPIQKIWMGFAILMGWFMSRILLSVLYYVILTPIGLISRIAGKRFLELKLDKSKESYWHVKLTGAIKISDY